MRSLVDCDLASILVLLSSSVMDDGPRAKSRLDCAARQTNAKMINYIETINDFGGQKRSRDGWKESSVFGGCLSLNSGRKNQSRVHFPKVARCHRERDGIPRATNGPRKLDNSSETVKRNGRRSIFTFFFVCKLLTISRT